jgi:hypothetical protein
MIDEKSLISNDKFQFNEARKKVTADSEAITE